MSTTLTIGQFKARLPEALALVGQGHSVVVTYGRAKRPVAVFSPPPASPKRKLGLLAGKATARMGKDWKLNPEELLGAGGSSEQRGAGSE